MADTGATNQRVTNAIIHSEIKYLTKVVESVESQQKNLNTLQMASNIDHENRLRNLEGNQRSLITSIDNLNSRVKAWNLTNSIGVIAAGILAAFGIRQ